MTVLHTGSTKQFASGWEAVFSGRKSGRTSASQAIVKKAKKSTSKKLQSAKKGSKSRAN